MALGAFIFFMCAGSFIQFLFLRGLRKHHPLQWEHAGCPTIWTDQSLFSAWPTISYIRRRAYRESGDVAGIAICERYRIALLIGYWGTTSSFVLFFFLLFSVGCPEEWQQSPSL